MIRNSSEIMKYIGIDISKATFTVAYSSDKKAEVKEFPNTATGIRKFINTLPGKCHCVMEATGPYSTLLLYLLSKAGLTVSMENPLKIKNFARVILSVTKTDRADARLIAMYGERMQPTPYKMPTETLMLLKQKRSVLRQLKKQLSATRNLQKSLEVLPVIDKTAKKAVTSVISNLEKQITLLEHELAEVTEKEFNRQLKLLTSVKGIGMTLATALIIATAGFSNFDNSKQLSRYLGLSPTYEQSGTSVNYRGHINRNGDSSLRGLLYMAAMPASRYNKACKETYTRLRERGKPGKVAIVAVANKLLRQAFAVVKSGVEYEDGFVSATPPGNQKTQD